MTDESDGGPAFPNLQPFRPDLEYCDRGMSLRDWFAGQAIQAISGACGPAPVGWSLSLQDHASWAYEIADAMLAARDK